MSNRVTLLIIILCVLYLIQYLYFAPTADSIVFKQFEVQGLRMLLPEWEITKNDGAFAMGSLWLKKRDGTDSIKVSWSYADKMKSDQFISIIKNAGVKPLSCTDLKIAGHDGYKVKCKDNISVIQWHCDKYNRNVNIWLLSNLVEKETNKLLKKIIHYVECHTIKEDKIPGRIFPKITLPADFFKIVQPNVLGYSNKSEDEIYMFIPGARNKDLTSGFKKSNEILLLMLKSFQLEKIRIDKGYKTVKDSNGHDKFIFTAHGLTDRENTLVKVVVWLCKQTKTSFIAFYIIIGKNENSGNGLGPIIKATCH